MRDSANYIPRTKMFTLQISTWKCNKQGKEWRLLKKIYNYCYPEVLMMS